ncbi:MAG: enoyl-CoA hydratase [Mycobacterium sp.]|nr:MAG: enoyl-CoA hydratase [Mycobacterium sp.]
MTATIPGSVVVEVIVMALPAESAGVSYLSKHLLGTLAQ